jgi:hypothetical protein
MGALVIIPATMPAARLRVRAADPTGATQAVGSAVWTDRLAGMMIKADGHSLVLLLPWAASSRLMASGESCGRSMVRVIWSILPVKANGT